MSPLHPSHGFTPENNLDEKKVVLGVFNGILQFACPSPVNTVPVFLKLIPLIRLFLGAGDI